MGKQVNIHDKILRLSVYSTCVHHAAQNDGKEILWQHLVTLYEQTRGQAGLSIIPKLTYEHMYLSSFSKMRVDIATLVAIKSLL